MKKHPDKHINDALNYVIANGWVIVEAGSSSHAWARLKCPYNDPSCRCGKFCLQSVWSTPKNPQNHAKQIRRIADRCINKDKEADP